MTSRVALVVGCAGIAVGLGVAAEVLAAGEAHKPPESTARLMYLTSGRTARGLTMAFNAVAADAYWIRTIQHYGRDRKSSRTVDRFALLEPLLDLTTTLDPHFAIAYRFGAIFLALPPPNGSGQVDRAIALLEKGLKADPGRWQYALDIGFIHYWHTGRYEEAGRWFARAAEMPRAPIWIKPLAGLTLAQGGDRQGARELLGNLANSDEQWIHQAAVRGLAQVEALDRIDAVQALVDRYFAEHHQYPAGWRDLAPPNAPNAVPVDPANVPLDFDTRTHRVILSLQSPLGPLPALQSRK